MKIIAAESKFSSPSGVESITFEFCDFENPAHLTALADLLNMYMADPMGDAAPLNKLQQLRLVDGLANHPAAFVLFVLYRAEIVGMATCFINFSTFNVKSYLNIHDFFVHPTFRGKGLATNLMQELISISTSRDYCKITLEVREDNVAAQGLYLSFGFEECKPSMLFWTKKL
ncbi:MAG: GNAT family N-acetyltransferase [Paludibacter sp.]|nr:GNAT family N-acetyltransferase [Paludibacter sp.]